MKLPQLQNPEKYTGLYVIDFGDHSGVGFTARETAELLESEKFKHIKVYKIHTASPDGKMELKGVQRELFELEAGMFFYSTDLETAEGDFKRLVSIAVTSLPPARAKVHLAKAPQDGFITAIIYPAEFDDEFSRWLLDCDYKTEGLAEGGINAVQSYYDSNPEIIRRHQLFATTDHSSRTGEQLLAATKIAVQR